MKKRCDIHKVARRCGVKLYDGARMYKKARGPKECFCPGTLRRIGRSLGESHLELVLRLIIETEGNEAELYGETLTAVSSVLENHPDIVDHGSALFEALDAIDLDGLRRTARNVRCGLPVAHIMRVLLWLDLQRFLSRKPAVHDDATRQAPPSS
ncbi:hypothetical protein [Hoeflea prorocentri]|uniref:Uncharacterized protein n=1 Tax=Hoeflea prorocentri TaxID=1922333 RepID=A0A9X3ZH88_9HYPH|nr:hypothetical protein [Hoeflea prorocentri]MCY6381044.1 hypothetical protein [Hoeflea prorocentri]MDA5398844.1 hypothetical protein [Hoeflea prorocentri]